MIPNLYIYRSAKVLIREHGEEANLTAAGYADAMLAKGNVAGLVGWKRIVRAVEEIERTEPLKGEGRIWVRGAGEPS